MFNTPFILFRKDCRLTVLLQCKKKIKIRLLVFCDITNNAFIIGPVCFYNLTGFFKNGKRKSLPPSKVYKSVSFPQIIRFDKTKNHNCELGNIIIINQVYDGVIRLCNTMSFFIANVQLTQIYLNKAFRHHRKLTFVWSYRSYCGYKFCCCHMILSKITTTDFYRKHGYHRFQVQQYQGLSIA